MCPGASQGQHQNIIFDAVDKQPIRLDMTFTIPCPITRQLMVSVLFRQYFTPRQSSDNIIQKINIQIPFNGQLVILFKSMH